MGGCIARQVCIIAALGMILTVAPACAESAADAQAKLHAFVGTYLENCNREIRPSRTVPAVRNRDGQVVASYIELDPASAQVAMYDATSPEFRYVARLTYVEHTYESVGNTSEEALAGVFQRVKSRRLTEMPRYASGRWEN